MSSELDQLVSSARRHATRPSALQREAIRNAVLASTSAISAIAVVKWLLGATTIVGLAAAVAVFPRLLKEAPQPVVPAVVVKSVAAVVPPAPEPVIEEPAALPPAPLLRLRAVKQKSREVAAPEAVETATLAEELELLRAATSAVDSKQFFAADATLARYAERVPRGRFATEAGVLRVLTWCGLNENERAQQLARQVIQHDGANPLTQRLRESCAASALEP